VKYAKRRLREKPHLRHESLMLQFKKEDGVIPNWLKVSTWNESKLEDLK